MTFDQIAHAQLISNYPVVVTNILLANHKPSIAVGNVLTGDGIFEAHWTLPQGECFVGEKPMPLHNFKTVQS